MYRRALRRDNYTRQVMYVNSVANASSFTHQNGRCLVFHLRVYRPCLCHRSKLPFKGLCPDSVLRRPSKVFANNGDVMGNEKRFIRYLPIHLLRCPLHLPIGPSFHVGAIRRRVYRVVELVVQPNGVVYHEVRFLRYDLCVDEYPVNEDQS